MARKDRAIASPLRPMLKTLAACMMVLGLVLPMLLLGAGAIDPLGSYRDAGRAARAPAVVTEVGSTGTAKVRHAGQPAGAAPVYLDDYGQGVPGWQAALKPGEGVEVAYLRSSPSSNVVPASLLDEIRAPTEGGWLLPLVVFVAYLGGGIALLVFAIRTPEARMSGYLPGTRGAYPPDPRARAVAYKVAAGVAAMLLAPVILLAVPAYVGITRDAAASTGWPRAPGMITGSRVDRRVTTTRRGDEVISYAPLVTARYIVAGRPWRTSAVRFDYLTSGSEANAVADVERYEKGDAVTVRHDPADPGRAVLEPGVVRPDALWYGAGAALAVATLLALLWWVRRPLPRAAAHLVARGDRAGAA